MEFFYSMKFLKIESSSFKNRIEKAELPYSSFSFIKKRGHLIIQFLDREPPFIFHRKNETKLNEKKEWEESSFYYIGKNMNDALPWRTVLKKFELWLKFLN